MTDYCIYTFADNDFPARTTRSKITADKLLAYSDAASTLKTTNIRIIATRELTAFEKWAHFEKGMLIDLDDNGEYKSLETRAYADTWKAAISEPLYIIKSLVRASKADRRIDKKIKTDIRKDYDILSAQAAGEKYVHDNQRSLP
jgi:hypothetical protein